MADPVKEFKLFCPDCGERMDTRNQRVAFCTKCAAIVDQVTGAAYNDRGQFLENVIARMIDGPKDHQR